MGQPDGLKKVGTAHKVAPRRNFIQCGAPFEVVVLATQALQNEQYAFALEQMCHIDLYKYWVFGEWFNAPLPVIVDVMGTNLGRLRSAVIGFDESDTNKDALWIYIRNALDLVERRSTRERTVAGLAAAKLRGRVGGRASYATDDQVLAVKRLGPTAAAKRLGYKTTAAYIRRLAEAEKRAAEAAAAPKPETAE